MSGFADAFVFTAGALRALGRDRDQARRDREHARTIATALHADNMRLELRIGTAVKYVEALICTGERCGVALNGAAVLCDRCYLLRILRPTDLPGGAQ